jgi:hypothetical protein
MQPVSNVRVGEIGQGPSPANVYANESVVASPQDSDVSTNEGAVGDSSGRVIRFRPRGGGRPSTRPLPSGGWNEPSLVADLTAFEHTSDRDDYRHRMIVNAIALLFVLALMAAGMWLAESLAALRKNQDCALMGRLDCAHISVPAKAL